jgi:hypothetical protein
MERHEPWLALTPNHEPGSTLFLTQHCGSQSQTVSQLARLETMLTSKSLQFNHSRFMNHLRTGSVRIPHHILIAQMELWGFIKSSVLYLSVNMELSLHLHFYLRRSLMGYTVGTTAGFPVEIMEALAPQSHHQIPRMCPQYHMSTYSTHRRVTGSSHPLRRGARGILLG